MKTITDIVSPIFADIQAHGGAQPEIALVLDALCVNADRTLDVILRLSKDLTSYAQGVANRLEFSATPSAPYTAGHILGLSNITNAATELAAKKAELDRDLQTIRIMISAAAKKASSDLETASGWMDRFSAGLRAE